MAEVLYPDHVVPLHVGEWSLTTPAIFNHTYEKVESGLILGKIFPIIHVNYSINAWKCFNMSL